MQKYTISLVAHTGLIHSFTFKQTLMYELLPHSWDINSLPHSLSETWIYIENLFFTGRSYGKSSRSS